jgi:biopolymer transport protein TolQ
VLNNLWSMNPVILLVLGILVAFSLISWSILIFKLLQIGAWKSATRKFLVVFGSHERPWEIDPASGYGASPLVPLFLEARAQAAGGHPMENVERTLRKTANREVDRLGKDIGFLATTAASTPFIGLFGTVWGIMNAFQGIGEAGSTSLAVVAPGISEALVTTAIGLATAIPALIGYNFLQSRIKGLVGQIDDFSGDLLNLIQKVPHG